MRLNDNKLGIVNISCLYFFILKASNKYIELKRYFIIFNGK